MQKFFQDEKNMSAIDRLINRLTGYRKSNHIDGDGISDLRLKLGEGLMVIKNMAVLFDENCSLNIEMIGNDFFDYVGRLNIDDDVEVQELFVMIYRFICEFEFNFRGNIGMMIPNIKFYVNKNFHLFSEMSRTGISSANMDMPARIVRMLIDQLSVNEIKKYNLNYQSLIDERKSLNEEFENRKNAVEELSINLKNQEIGYSFVTLVKGFDAIRKKKEEERAYAFHSLWLLASLAFVPLLIELTLFWFNRDVLVNYKDIIIYVLPPLIALEIIAIYFFRVVLVHFKSVKAQLLQLDLRVSLCQFIQGYSKYAQEVKKNDSASLEKFENLIFSGIISNEENLPSTFDGTDQLAKLIKALKG